MSVDVRTPNRRVAAATNMSKILSGDPLTPPGKKAAAVATSSSSSSWSSSAAAASSAAPVPVAAKTLVKPAVSSPLKDKENVKANASSPLAKPVVAKPVVPRIGAVRPNPVTVTATAAINADQAEKISQLEKKIISYEEDKKVQTSKLAQETKARELAEKKLAEKTVEAQRIVLEAQKQATQKAVLEKQLEEEKLAHKNAIRAYKEKEAALESQLKKEQVLRSQAEAHSSQLNKHLGEHRQELLRKDAHAHTVKVDLESTNKRLAIHEQKLASTQKSGTLKSLEMQDERNKSIAADKDFAQYKGETKSTIEVLNAKLVALEAKLAVANDKAAAAWSAADLANASITKEVSNSANVKESLRVMTSQYEQAKQECERLKAQLASLQASMIRSEQDSSAEVYKTRSDMAQTLGQLQSQRDYTLVAERDSATMQEKQTAQQRELLQAQEMISQLMSSHTELQKQIEKDHAETIPYFQQVLQTREAEVACLKRDLHDTQESLAHVELLHQEMQSQVVALQEALQHEAAEKKALIENVESAEKAVEVAKAQNRTDRAKMDDEVNAKRALRSSTRTSTSE